MRNRLTSDGANSVSLFPFLAVLLCTMGALLVLLVVLAQRAGERILAEAAQPNVAPASFQPPVVDDSDDEAEELLRQLEEVRAYQAKLSEIREEGEQRLLEEKQRLSHLEKHTRELEHELARLSLAAEQLKATEEDQTVDQEQAERELARLQQLTEETEADLEELREEKQGQRSYAIVPYRGPNGTYRKPVYIECRRDAVILHPEGIRFAPSDFPPISWPGNPLAAALRATRNHVNAQAAKLGAAEPPDPYPMILVRPDGISNYLKVRAAITSWDASFGYEFIDGDWKLEFPEDADPLLAREQEHAILLARERLARLIRSAPRRFQGVGLGGTGTGAAGGRAGTNGFGDGNSDGEFNSGPQLGQATTDGTGEGNGFAGGESSAASVADSGQTTPGGETQYGAMAGGGTGGSEGELFGDSAEGGKEQGEESGGPGGDGGLGERYAQASGTGAAGGSADSASGGPGGGQTSGGGASAGGPSAGGEASAGASGSAGGQATSIADARGSNWAVQGKGRNAVAIRRPIQVVVRQDQLALLPSRHATGGDAATGKVISLNQPLDQISDEFVTALRTRIDEWGLAGSGLYWRPVLKLNIGPDAEQTARQLLRLLRDSGVEVSLPDTARVPHGGMPSVTR